MQNNRSGLKSRKTDFKADKAMKGAAEKREISTAKKLLDTFGKKGINCSNFDDFRNGVQKNYNEDEINKMLAELALEGHYNVPEIVKEIKSSGYKGKSNISTTLVAIITIFFIINSISNAPVVGADNRFADARNVEVEMRLFDSNRYDSFSRVIELVNPNARLRGAFNHEFLHATVAQAQTADGTPKDKILADIMLDSGCFVSKPDLSTGDNGIFPSRKCTIDELNKYRGHYQRGNDPCFDITTDPTTGKPVIATDIAEICTIDIKEFHDKIRNVHEVLKIGANPKILEAIKTEPLKPIIIFGSRTQWAQEDKLLNKDDMSFLVQLKKDGKMILCDDNAKPGNYAVIHSFLNDEELTHVNTIALKTVADVLMRYPNVSPNPWVLNEELLTILSDTYSFNGEVVKQICVEYLSPTTNKVLEGIINQINEIPKVTERHTGVSETPFSKQIRDLHNSRLTTETKQEL